MKNLICFNFALFLSLLGHTASAAKFVEAKRFEHFDRLGIEAIADSIGLTSRYVDQGDYVTATYSFRHLTRDNIVLTRNNWELLYEGYENGQADYFRVNTVTDDVSYLFDLGKGKCSSLPSHVRIPEPDERGENPVAMFYEGNPYKARKHFTGTDLVPVELDHCYLTVNHDTDGDVIAMFHVADHWEYLMVRIDEVQILKVDEAR